MFLIFLLLFIGLYLFVEIHLLLITNTTLLTKTIIYFNIKCEVEKKLPAWWKIKKIDFFDIICEYKGCYSCFLIVESEYDKRECEIIITNKWGRIKEYKNNIFDIVRHYDEHNKNIVIQLNRDSILEKIGI